MWRKRFSKKEIIDEPYVPGHYTVDLISDLAGRKTPEKFCDFAITLESLYDNNVLQENSLSLNVLREKLKSCRRFMNVEK